MDKIDPLAWQADYAAQLLRTSGSVATFTKAGGGWWVLVVNGKPSYQKHRTSDILKMTERLSTREPAVLADVEQGLGPA